MEKTLTCVFFPDLLPWEREGLQPMVETLQQWGNVEIVEFDPDESPAPKGRIARGPYWILSHRWERALAALQLPQGTKTFVSVLSPPRPAAFFTTLFWQRFRPLGEGVRLIAHSPLSFRFLCEINQLPPERVLHLPLPLGTPEKGKSSRNKTVSVGVMARFVSESNLHSFLNVAHYVVHRKEGIQFRILGAGPLQNHLEEIIRELGLQAHVTIDEGATSLLSQFDMMMYLPLQNSHFLPVLQAGRLGIPVVACEVPGIEEYIHDGKDGFVVPINDTKPMAELVLRLASDATFRASLGQKLQASLTSGFHFDRLVQRYATAIGTPFSQLSRAA